jgi:DNA-binding MarR family transcriptional regulator
MEKSRNPIVELIKSWEIYEQEHPDANAAGFCRFFLEKEQTKTKIETSGNSEPEQPPMGITNALGVTIARINKYVGFYSRKVMQTLPVDNTEDFFYLAHLHFEGAMRKSELINKNISEFTSGTNVINRLLKHQLIEEWEDPHDARSKQVKITSKGVDWIQDCLPDMVEVYHLTFDALAEEDKEMVYRILVKVDELHTQHYFKLRNLNIQQIKEHIGYTDKGHQMKGKRGVV